MESSSEIFQGGNFRTFEDLHLKPLEHMGERQLTSAQKRPQNGAKRAIGR